MDNRTIVVNQEILAAPRRAAAEFRADWSRLGTLVVNLVSSPGAGKTSLLEAMARYWNGSRKAAVLVGDIATDRDAERLAGWYPVRQLTTGGACHLDPRLVAHGYDTLPDAPYEFLLIENVGNLVCPASHDLGEHLRVVLLSCTEGDDKPGKYPKMFRTSHAMIVTKTDLLPHVPFQVAAAIADARRIQGDLDVFEVHAPSGHGVVEWCAYLDARRERLLREQG